MPKKVLNKTDSLEDTTEVSVESIGSKKPWSEDIPESVYPPEKKPSGKKPWSEDIPESVYPPEKKPSGKKPYQI